MGGAIWGFFQSDHARLDALLRQALGRPGELDEDAFSAFRAGLLRHIALEEKILLPAARRLRGGEPLAIERELRVGHGAIALLLVPFPTRDLAEELRSILEPHNRLEEAPDGLYAICDEILTRDAEEVLNSARSYPEVKVAAYRHHPNLCRTAREALRIAGGRSGSGTPPPPA